MPVRRGNSAPQNTFLDTLIRKFDGQNRKFCIANARLESRPVIFCNDEFCDLVGYSRADIMQRSACMEFLHGPLTSVASIAELRDALHSRDEKQVRITFYKKDGTRFVSNTMIAPVRNEAAEVMFYILTFQQEGLSSLFAAMTRGDRRDSLGLKDSLRGILRAALVGLKIKNDDSFSAEDSDPFGSGAGVRDRKASGGLELPRGDSLLSLSPSFEGVNVGEASEMFHHQKLFFIGCIVWDIYGLREVCCSRASTRKLESRRVDTHRLSVRQNVTEKVAQMLTFGTELPPESKMQSPEGHRCIILHYSPFKSVWDWFILVLVIYTSISTPYVAAFLLDNNQKRKLRQQYELNIDPVTGIDIIIDIMFIIDIIINFRTTYVNKNDEVVTHPGRIAVHYFKGWFLIDVVSAIPFDLLLWGAETEEPVTLIGLLKTARLLRLVRVARKLGKYSEYGAAVLMLLMATFALIAHWLACVWYAIGNLERPILPQPIGWLDQLADQASRDLGWVIQGGRLSSTTKETTHYRDHRSSQKYITALYFTFSSLTSKVFSICVMLIGSLMYASIFGNVSAIIQRLYSGTARYHTQMLRVREFIRFHQIPNPLRQRLEEYFQHAWSYTNGIDMNLVLKGFPECLQADICLHLNRNLLRNCPAFKEASPGCLRTLSMKFKSTHVPPGDILVHRGDILSALYFVARQHRNPERGHGSGHPRQGRHIRRDSLRHETVGKSKCNVRALTYCDLHKIQRDDLLETLEMYPGFSEYFVKNLEITFDLRDEELSFNVPLISRVRRANQTRNRPSLAVNRPRRLVSIATDWACPTQPAQARSITEAAAPGIEAGRSRSPREPPP
uniref:PAS domain-containing protein n=1 Tax=Macrostomum lignano TaxID=282301 RepID=A0A1I8GUC4_9PLAT